MVNIFWLDWDLQANARFYSDSHVVKIPLEITQMLWTAHHELGSDLSIVPETVKIYKKTHTNHPCAKWCRETLANYKLAAELGVKLCEEHFIRYPKEDGKKHACLPILKWLLENPPKKLSEAAEANEANEAGGVTPPPLCMPVECQLPGNTIGSFRRLYRKKKSRELSKKGTFIHRWKNGRPKWL